MHNQFLIINDYTSKKDIALQGNRFLIGNLQLGIRGTLDECTKDDMVGLNLPFIYDQQGGAWREPVNAPNPLYFQVFVNDKPLHAFDGYVKHTQTLDISCGLFSRKTVFDVDGNLIELISKRFVSEKDSRRILVSYKLTAQKAAMITIVTGIDGDIWDINGPHLSSYKMTRSSNHIKLQTSTLEKKRNIAIHEYTIGHVDYDESITQNEQHIYRHITFHTKGNQTYTFHKYARIAVDENDSDSKFIDAIQENFEDQLIEHKKIWQIKWHTADVTLLGDDAANQALKYSIYHLLMLSPFRFPNTSIPARGISGQTYKGAVFWDTEIFLLPFFLNTDQKAARHLIEYRIKTLKGALEKAASYGYKGAFYPWESQEDGIEACTDYNVVDVFTNRKVRTYFKDKQIHISGDVVYALWSYYERTKDIQILIQGGADVILACARFYQDRSYWHINKKRAEYLDVLGPDEYHERVHNNAFTNQMVRFVFYVLEQTSHLLKTHYPNFYHQWISQNKNELSIDDLIQFGHNIYIKEKTDKGFIEQFDGYMSLRDQSLESLLQERLHPNEYLGGSGLAGDTKIIKQADVITMLYLFKSQYDKACMTTNFNYYEPRTEHGSSLSASMYALIACMIDQPTYAYHLFMKSATIDLTGNSKQYAGGIYIGGTHPAAAGGAYMTAVYGFAGLCISKHGDIECKPHLPDSIKGMMFTIVLNREIYRISIIDNQVNIKKEKQT